MTAALSTSLVASEHVVDVGAPPLVWGLGALIFFMVLLAITLAFGKGR